MTGIWVVVLVVIILGGSAALALGHGGGLGRASSDRPELRLPADRPLGAEDLEVVEFSLAPRGYRMDEVDEVMHRLVGELAERDALIAELAQPRHRAADHPDAAEGAADRGSQSGASPSGDRPSGDRPFGDWERRQ